MAQKKRPIKLKELTAQRKKERILQNPPRELTGDLNIDLSLLDKLLHRSADIVIREFTLSAGEGIGVGLVYADALVDKQVMIRISCNPLMHLARLSHLDQILTKDNAFQYVEEHLLTIGEIRIPIS